MEVREEGMEVQEETVSLKVRIFKTDQLNLNQLYIIFLFYLKYKLAKI